MVDPGTPKTMLKLQVKISNWRFLVRVITVLYFVTTLDQVYTRDTAVRHKDDAFAPRTVDQCFGQTIPIKCDPGHMVQVIKVFYRQARHCHGSFHSSFCTRAEPSNPACVGNDTCVFTTPYIYLSPECGYSNNFLVTYKCIPASKPWNICQEGTLTAPTGYIVSPRYPAKYPPSQNCKVTIQAVEGSIIKVYLLDLFLAYYNYDVTKQCVDKMWMVGEGERDRTNYLCSGQQRGLVFTSKSNQVTVYFASESQKHLNAKGFWLYYEAVESKTVKTPPTLAPQPTRQAAPVKTLPPTPVTSKGTTIITTTPTTTTTTTTTVPTTTTIPSTTSTTIPTTTTEPTTTPTTTTPTTRATTITQATTMDPAPKIIYYRDHPKSSDKDIDLTEFLDLERTEKPNADQNLPPSTPPYRAPTSTEHKSLFVEDFNNTLQSKYKVVFEEDDGYSSEEGGIEEVTFVNAIVEPSTEVTGEMDSYYTEKDQIEGTVGLENVTQGTVINGSREGNLTVMLEMYNEVSDKNRPKLPLWAKETPSQAAVFFRQMDDTTRKSIVGGAGGCLVLVLAITVLAILIKRRRSTKNIAPPLQPCVQPKNFDDIILAYGSNDSSKGFINVGFENESVQDFSIDSTSQSDSSCTWSGTMNSWRGLNPIDEGPEIVYMDAKTAASKTSSGCSKKVKWVKSKSLDDIRHTIRLTQRQFASRGGYSKKKHQDKEPFTSLASLDEDTDGSELSTASTTKLTLAASKQYNTLNDLASCLAQSETTLYSNASTTDSQQITFSGEARTDSYSPYETVHFQHQEEVAL